MSTATFAHDTKSSAAASASKSVLRVNRSGDLYEREAEHAAEQVMTAGVRRATWSLSRVGGGAPLQRECSCGGTCEECGKKKEDVLQREASAASPAVAPAAVHDVLRGAGRPLDRGTRGFMESRFGQDFSGVRIFNDSAAASSARAVAAHAYTVGNKIVFNSGRYAPESASGQKLLAHELAHVVQQQHAPAASGSRLKIGGQDDASERAAGQAAQASEREQGSSFEAGSLALTGMVSKQSVQRIPSYAEIKESAYKGLVYAARKTTQVSLAALRKLATHLPASMQSGASTLIEIADVVIGAVFAVVLAVIGIIVGATEGVADMVTGLVSLVLGIAKVLFDVISGLFTNFDALKQDWTAIVAAVTGLPAAVKALVKDWLDRFEKASSERQSLMIGELTGQIIALIGTFELSAGRAGTAAKVGAEAADVAKAAELAEAAAKAAEAAKAADAAAAAAKAADAAKAAEAAANASKATRPALQSIKGGGATTPARATTATAAARSGAVAKGGAVARGGGSVGRGGQALAVAEDAAAATEEAPKIVLRAVPEPIVPTPVTPPLPITPSIPAPLTAPLPIIPPVTAPGLGRAVAAGGTIAAAKGTQIVKDQSPAPDPVPDDKKKKKRKRCSEAEPVEPLPILWPEELPHPGGELVRTKGDLREVLGTDRGPNQARFGDCIRRWKVNPRGMDLEDACPDRGFYQKDLMPSEGIDAHHIHPLYLGGGDDWQGNLGAVEVQRHRRGHVRLDNQQKMFTLDPTWELNKVCSPILSQHPVDQEYYIAADE